MFAGGEHKFAVHKHKNRLCAASYLTVLSVICKDSHIHRGCETDTDISFD